MATRTFLIFAAKIVLSITLSACASRVSIDTNKAQNYTKQSRRLFVVEVVDARLPISQPFRENFTKLTKSCGVTLGYFLRHAQEQSLALETSDQQTARQNTEIAKFRPDSVLGVTPTSFVSGSRSGLQTVNYSLELLDPASRKLVWKAAVTLHIGAYSGATSWGETLATGIVDRMKQDGILGSCDQAAAPTTAAPASAVSQNTAEASAIAPAKNGPTFSFEGKSYPTAEAMFDARRLALAAKTDAVPKVPTPIKGRALLVLPSHDALKPLAAQTGQILQGLLGNATSGTELMIDNDRIDLQASADAVIKAKLFKSATVAERDETLAPDLAGADYLVWYQVRQQTTEKSATWTGQWMVRRAGAGAPVAVILPKDVTAGTTAYYAAFVQRVRDAVQMANHAS